MKIKDCFPLRNSNGDRHQEEWRDIKWPKIRKYARRLENSIAKAVEYSDWAQVKKMRRIWDSSRLIKLLAIRKVTQDNRGKRTAGVDKVRALTGKARLSLVDKMELDGNTKPLRRILIPKANGENRPLGIPTIEDRCKMELVKGRLQPMYEARAEPNVYGFRPGRSAHDAIQAIFKCVVGKPKYVLEGDLSKFFDNIKPEAILDSEIVMRAGQGTRNQIKAWIEAGYIDKDGLHPTDKGTPQGGVISPLLANIAFMGLERMLKEWAGTWKGRRRENMHAIHVSGNICR